MVDIDTFPWYNPLHSVLSIIKPFVETDAGRSNFSIMLATHNATFPNYVAEVEGMARVRLRNNL